MHLMDLILAGLLLLATIQGAVYFLAVQKTGAAAWLMFNACAVANLAFLSGLAVFRLAGTLLVAYTAVLPLFFFGTLGLFVFPWRGAPAIAQVSHVLMTLNLAALLADMVRAGDYRNAAIGLLAGIFLFSIFIAAQQHYVYRHLDRLHELTSFRPVATHGAAK